MPCSHRGKQGPYNGNSINWHLTFFQTDGKGIAAQAPKSPIVSETPKSPIADQNLIAKNIEGEQKSAYALQKGKLPELTELPESLELPEAPRSEMQVTAQPAKEAPPASTSLSDPKALFAAAKEEKQGTQLPVDITADSSREAQAGKLASRQEEAVATVNEPASKGKEIAVMEKAGTTETIVVLKNPPIFEGARLVVTGFDSAKKDIHIAFVTNEKTLQCESDFIKLRDSLTLYLMQLLQFESMI